MEGRGTVAVATAVLLLVPGCYEGIEPHREIGPVARDLIHADCTAATARHVVPVLSISYLPTADGVNLDAAETGVALTLDEMRSRIAALNSQTVAGLEEGSRYRGYAAPSDCSIHYEIVERFEYTKAIPPSANPAHPTGRIPDYRSILEQHDICRRVDEGLREVWIWGYHTDRIVPSESNMAGPYGDISNSQRIDDMPTCRSSYTLYNYNYGREVAEALHNHGHQIEAVMHHLYPQLFFDWRYPKAGEGGPSSCGDVHFPPNTRDEYIYDDPTPVESDCTDWLPGAQGNTRTVSCEDWSCNERESSRAYLIWWMQNLPGRDNGLGVGNWWDAIADFDSVAALGGDCGNAC